MGTNTKHVEDALIPFIILENIKLQIELRPSLRANHRIYSANIGLDLRKYFKIPGVKDELKTAAKPVMAFFNNRQWSPRRRYMLLSALADALYLAGVDIGERNKKVVADMSKTIVNAYDSEEYKSENIKEEDSEVIEYVPQVLAILQQMGYFR